MKKQIQPINQSTFKIIYDKYSSVKIGGETKDFKPEALLDKWNGECWIKIKYPTTKNIVPLQEDGKIKWIDTNKEVHLYPLEPREFEENGHTVRQLENGGFEFEIILKKKPKTNKIVLNIETKGLKFYYQPELTQKEKDEGCFRPENVVGSYAVCHKTQDKLFKTQAEGEKYKAGIFGMIYRPKITDAEGNWAWESQVIDTEKGEITITIPQSFLDNAVYPIRSTGETFGYTSKGASFYRLARQSSSYSYRLGTTFSFAGSGTLDKITLWIALESAGSETLDISAFINIEDSVESGSHGQVVKIENSKTVNSTTYTEFDFTAGNEELSANNYLLNACGDGSDVNLSGQEVLLAYQSTGSNNWYVEYGIGAYASLSAENPWVASLDGTGRNFSIYATYTPTGGNDYTESCTEVLSLAEIPAKKFEASKSFTNVIPLVDSLTKSQGFSETKTETIGMADIQEKASNYHKTNTDIINLSDIISKTTQFAKSIVSSISLSDIITKLRKSFISIIDTIGLNEIIVKTATYKKSFTNVIALVESTAKKLAFKKTITDTITLVDSILKKMGVIITDTITLVESVLKKSVFKKVFIDIITFVDSVVISTLTNFVETITEVLQLADTIVKKLSFKKTLVSLITLQDIKIISQRFTVIITDTITLVDSVLKKVSLFITDIVSLVDSITKKSIWSKSITEILKLKSILTFIASGWKYKDKSETSPTWTHKDKSETSPTWTWQNRNQ